MAIVMIMALEVMFDSFVDTSEAIPAVLVICSISVAVGIAVTHILVSHHKNTLPISF